MTRSAYATTSALSVACPECKQSTGSHCVRYDLGSNESVTRYRSHSARRRAADAQRTQEVNPKVRGT
jgi:hypothetical protein